MLVRLRKTASSASVPSQGLSKPQLLARNRNENTDEQAVTQLYHITDGSTVEAKMTELAALPNVEIVSPDYLVYTQQLPPVQPNDQYFLSGQWHLPKISALDAWNTHTGDWNVKVCIIDSGMRIDHPDLAQNIIKGWNLVPEDQDNPGPSSEPGEPNYYNFNDTMGHGTHVAGIITALGNNTRGVSGVSWKAGLLVCKFIWDYGAGYVSDAIKCMELCSEEGAHIYNNSWGDLPNYDNVLLAAIKDLESTGGLFVVAAGNNGQNLDLKPMYPGAYSASNLLSVAATDINDNFASFSNYGRSTVGIAAPGKSILSTTHDADYGMMSGTSMACPVVAGTAALLQSMAISAGTILTPKQIITILTSNVDLIAGGGYKLKSAGRVNVDKAVQYLKARLPAASPSPLPKAPSPPPPRYWQPAPPPSPSQDFGTYLPPVCGSSLMKGRTATQSSTFEGRDAAFAVNGDCRMNITAFNASCSSTDPNQDNPWWQASLANTTDILAVSITPRSDCCWDSIVGARVLLGNVTWAGSNSAEFIECGQISTVGIGRGLRLRVMCPTTIPASQVVVYLPKQKTSLSLCEVDITARLNS